MLQLTHTTQELWYLNADVLAGQCCIVPLTIQTHNMLRYHFVCQLYHLSDKILMLGSSTVRVTRQWTGRINFAVTDRLSTCRKGLKRTERAM